LGNACDANFKLMAIRYTEGIKTVTLGKYSTSRGHVQSQRTKKQRIITKVQSTPQAYSVNLRRRKKLQVRAGELYLRNFPND